ncbi:MAG: hypothetical protein IEMM0008_1834 [bacterium]|nr:MAG: hypothetical protein IEMM0008_1834 [bacterium]
MENKHHESFLAKTFPTLLYIFIKPVKSIETHYDTTILHTYRQANHRLSY